MKKLWIVLVLVMLFLCGCSAEETFETLSDIWAQPAMATLREVELTLPKDAAVQTLQSDAAGKLYLCDGYILTVQNLPAGDLSRTLVQLTGRTQEQLTLMQTKRDALDCYETVWCAAGEGGDQMGRALILDDGNYHYAVCVMADAAVAGELTPTWQQLMNSVSLRTD